MRIPRTSAAWLLTALAFGAARAAAPSHQLKPLERFLGKTWKALVDIDKGLHDVARWELALGGQAVRIRHSVGDGVYGGESYIVWDQEKRAW